MTDPGFDFSVLSQFRTRLVAHDLQNVAFEMLLDRLVELGLVAARGRQRTDATHVVATVRDLNRLEMVGETLRAALEALAAAAPQWLTGQIDAATVKRYGARIDEWRLQKDQAGRQKLAVQTGRDGHQLLKAVADRRAPAWLREIPAVEVLRQVWIQQYTLSESGRAVIWRDTPHPRAPAGQNPDHLPIRHRCPLQRETRHQLGRLQSPHHRDLVERHEPPDWGRPRHPDHSSCRDDDHRRSGRRSVRPSVSSTARSFCESNDAVASSSSMIGASLRMAQALETRWRSPPESRCRPPRHGCPGSQPAI